ncbi:MAG: energy transducer TonB [Bryobacteraceae bacterium]
MLALLAIFIGAPAVFAQEGKLVVVSDRAFRDSATFRIEPEYPATARQFRMRGEVLAEVVVGPDGKVESVSVKKGNPLLATSVNTALRRWTFKPFLAEGRSVRVKSALTFKFEL